MMVLNKILRQCFNDWIKENPEQKILNTKFHSNRICKQKTNVFFWKYLYDNAEIDKTKYSFDLIYSSIKKSLQIKRKVIKKKSYEFNKRKIKYMNVELDKGLRKNLMSFLSGSKKFFEVYKQFKKNIFKEYDQFKNPFSFSVVKIKNDPFEIDIKSNVKNNINALITFRSNLQKNLHVSSFKNVGKEMKNIKFPFTLNDYIKIFELFEGGFKEELLKSL